MITICLCVIVLLIIFMKFVAQAPGPYGMPILGYYLT